MKYSVTPIEGNMSIRDGHSTGNVKMATLGANTTGLGDEIWTCTVDGELVGAKVGDMWLRLEKPTKGWVAIRHGGHDYCKLTETGPESPFVAAILVRADGTTVEFEPK